MDDLNVLEMIAEDQRVPTVVGDEADAIINEQVGGDPTQIDDIVVDLSRVRNNVETAVDIDGKRLAIKNNGLITAREVIELRDLGADVGIDEKSMGAIADVPTSNRVDTIVEAVGESVQFMIAESDQKLKSLMTNLIKELNSQGQQALEKADVFNLALAKAVNDFIDKYGWVELDFYRGLDQTKSDIRIGSGALVALVADACAKEETDLLDKFLIELCKSGLLTTSVQARGLVSQAMTLSVGSEDSNGSYALDALGRSADLNDCLVVDPTPNIMTDNSGRFFFTLGKGSFIQAIREVGGAMMGLATNLSQKLEKHGAEGEEHNLLQCQETVAYALEAAQVAKCLKKRFEICSEVVQKSIELYQSTTELEKIV